MRYSNLVERLQGERTSAWDIHTAAKQAAGRGEDVIILSVGDPDLSTPSPIVERAIAAHVRAIRITAALSEERTCEMPSLRSIGRIREFQ